MRTVQFLGSLHAPALLACATLIGLVGCSKDPEPEPLAKEGEACAVAADCEDGLLCRGEVCTAPAAMPDMGDSPDGGEDTDSGPDANNNTPMVEDEDYLISYLLKVGFGDEKGRTFLHIADTKTLTTKRVSDMSNHCEYGCWLSEDVSTFVYIRPVAGGTSSFDVYSAAVGDDLTVSGDGSVIISAAERVQFNKSTITFMRDDEGAKTAYAYTIGVDTERVIGEATVRGEQTQDSWYVDDVTGKSVLYSPTLQTLSIRVGEVGTAIEEADQVYLLDAANYQEVGGSYFGTNIPSALSSDGRYLALLTTAPNNYASCMSDAECDGERGQHCGEEGRCTVRETAVRLFDLEALDELPNGDAEGKTCTGDADCSPAHECYIPSNIQLDLARCIPRRVILGLPNTPKQPRVGATQRFGCEITANDDGMNYTDVRAPMTFGPDGNLYVVAARECAEFEGETNVGDTDIVRISPMGGVVDVISGNGGADFNDALCYNETERMVDIEQCVVYTKEAVLSPEGNELAFLATNPETTDPDKATVLLDVWTVLSDGSKREWIGKSSAFDEVKRLIVHPAK